MDLYFHISIPVVMLLAVLQSTVTSRIQLFGASPDLVLLFVISWALQRSGAVFRGLREGIVIALAGGMILDALSGASFGVMTVALCAVSGMAGLGEINIFRTARVLPYVGISIATLVYDSILIVLLRAGGHPLLWGPAMWRIVLPSAVINLLCMPIVYYATQVLVWPLRKGGRGNTSLEWQ